MVHASNKPLPPAKIKQEMDCEEEERVHCSLLSLYTI